VLPLLISQVRWEIRAGELENMTIAPGKYLGCAACGDGGFEVGERRNGCPCYVMAPICFQTRSLPGLIVQPKSPPNQVETLLKERSGKCIFVQGELYLSQVIGCISRKNGQEKSAESEGYQNNRKVRVVHAEEIPEEVDTGKQKQPGDQASDEGPWPNLSKKFP
jgi:hypothetical protein